MVPAEQDEFVVILGDALGLYGKLPTAPEVEVWWRTCRAMALADVERAFRDHAADPDDGKRAPRPVDVHRRISFGVQQGSGCSASGAAGRCEYPGIFSEGTTGGERWWCPWHRTERIGPEAERWIEISRRVPYAEAMAKRVERMARESQRAADVVNLAHSTALRLGDRSWPQPRRFTLPGDGSEA